MGEELGPYFGRVFPPSTPHTFRPSHKGVGMLSQNRNWCWWSPYCGYWAVNGTLLTGGVVLWLIGFPESDVGTWQVAVFEYG